MKNFDEARDLRPRIPVEDRTFVLGGEKFVARDRFRPEVLAPLDGLRDAETDPTRCSCGHRLHEHNPKGDGAGSCAQKNCPCKDFSALIIDRGTPLGETIEVIDRTLLGMIEDEGAHDRFRTLRAREDDPLQVPDLMDVIKWMTALDADRPTGASGDSTPGRDQDGTSSTASSSSPEQQAA